MMKITLKQLNVFIQTYKLGSLSKAADACFITQSAASMSLAELEKLLGFPLFDRNGKKLIINSNGLSLLPKATDILDRTNELESYSQIGINELSGTINIGASTTIGNYILPKYLANFQQKHPNITINFNISNTREVKFGVNNLEFDLGIVEGDCHSETISKQVWLMDELVIIANNKHALAKKQRVSLKDITHYNWVMREEGSGTGKLFQDYIENKDTFKTEQTLTNPEAIKSYIRNSDCLSCVSKTIINKIDKDIKILPVTGFKLMRPFYLLIHKNKYKNAATAAFEALLTTEN
jgi:DNA-binding transcriptional LysR family regulator